MGDFIRIDPRVAENISDKAIRPGRTVTVRVESVLGKGRYRIHFGGRSLIAFSHLQLSADSRLRARVLSGPAGLRLHVLPESADSGGASFLSATRPRDVQEALIQAFQRASLSLPNPGEMYRIASLLARSRGRLPRMTRLFAEIYSRGADPSADFLEAVDNELHGDRGGSHGKGSGNHHADGRSPASWSESPTAAELADEFRMDNPGNLLTLLNTASREDSWVFGRLKRYLKDRQIDMTVKFRKGSHPALVLSVRDGKREFEFILEGEDPVEMAVLVDDPQTIPAKIFDRFSHSLSQMKVNVGATLSTLDDGDGFAPWDTYGIE